MILGMRRGSNGSRKNQQQQQDLEEANQRIVQAESAAISAREKVEEYEALCGELMSALKEKDDTIQQLGKDAENATREKETAVKERREAAEKLRRLASSSSSSSARRYTRYTIQEVRAATKNFSDEAKIGEGSFGTVYKGMFHVTPVAIKVLKLNFFQGSNHFQREMDRISGLKHPRLVMLMGACPDGGCIVYEYMARGSLCEQLAPAETGAPPLPWFDRLRIAAEVCEGLLFMHNLEPHPLFHNNLKPSNVLLDADLGSRIADAGLLRLVSDRSRAPAVGPEADTRSFGLLLVNLLTGKPDLPAEALDAVAEAIYESSEDSEASEIEEENPLGAFLDPAAKWPALHARRLAEIAVSCRKCEEVEGKTQLQMAMEALERAVAAMNRPEVRVRPFLQVPEGFRCPISWCLMEDPYVAADGYSYEYQHIKAWVASGNSRSPVTDAILENLTLVPNHSLRSAIEFWRNATSEASTSE